MSKHRVRVHDWVNGTLKTLDHFFDSLDEASLFANNVDAHTIKIYDTDGALVHTVASKAVPNQTPSRSDSYA
jgi:hypothetical protein